MSNASECSYNSSYSPDFKNYIEENSGNLFYIRANALVDDHGQKIFNSSTDESLFRNQFKRMSLRQRDKGILSKFTNKKSKYEMKVVEKNSCLVELGKTIDLKILNKTVKINNKLPKLRRGDERSLFEIIFNASIILGPDNKRFLIDKINQTSVFEKYLSVGDYIKSIDGDVITGENINMILARILNQKTFKVVAEEFYRDEYHTLKEEIKLTKINDIVTLKDKLFQLENEYSLIFSLNIIVKNEQITEESDDYTTVFSFPPKENNFLHKLKGSFLTIASIMKISFDNYPTLTSIKVHDTTFHITYTIRNNGNEFIFLGFNSNYAGTFDAKHLANNFVKFLDYIYPNFIIINDFDQLISFCEIIKIRLLKRTTDAINFEELFSCSKFVSLPKEIVLRINDALSELEAMDYRNWNESLMELFGKFSIIGSSLFYKTSLICSHFNESDMDYVDLFLRHFCLKFLFERCVIREMCVWQRVYPKDYQSFNMENDSTKNKLFLLTVSNGYLTMCVILEENGFNFNNPEIEAQSSASNYLIYFLEEMQDVVDHLKMVGIENLTKIWINSAKRPQCKNPFLKEPEVNKKELHHYLKNIKEESEDEDGDRDYESHIESSRQSSGGFDNDETIYKDFEDIIPQTLTFGPENVLFHFTQIDFKEGIIITSINEKSCIQPDDILIDIFRRGCLNIHQKLQNTVRFNQMLYKENKVSNSNKTAMLPKEQGVLIELNIEKQALNFWIVGRLFGNRELYVCYDSKIPQNMVEIAFRLAINCCG